MARILSARTIIRSLNSGVKALLLIALASTFATLSGLAQAQTSAPIALTGSSFCADVDSQSLTPGAAVLTWTCNGGANQSWLPSASGSQYTLLNQNSNLCMDVSGASKAAGAPVIQWTCNGGTNQSFTLKAQGSGYAIVAVHSGMCLAAASQTNQGAQVLQQVCNGSALQTWQVNGLPRAALISKWTAPITLPIIPVAAANLPDGTVLVLSLIHI